MLRIMVASLSMCVFLTIVPQPSGAAQARGDLPLYGIEEFMETLENSADKVVLINFFATWCPPCMVEIPHIMSIRKETPNDKLVIIGVSIDDDIAELRKFVAKTKFNYPIYRGEAELVAGIRIEAIPHMVIVDRQGELCYSEPGLLPETRLRQSLDRLLAGQRADICYPE